MSRTSKPAVASNVKPSPAPAKSANLSWKDRLLPEELEGLRNTFDLFDQDHSGFIDPEQINKIMAELGESRKGTFTYNIIEGLKSKNKPINFDDFVDLVTPKVGDIKTKEGLRTIFSHVDKDGDDIINYEELKQLARLSGDYINDEQILELLHSIFVNYKTASNEELHFEQFYNIVSAYYKKKNH